MKLTFEDMQVGARLLLADRSAKVLAKDYALDEDGDVDPKKYWTTNEAIKSEQWALCVLTVAGMAITGFELMKGVMKLIKAVKR